MALIDELLKEKKSLENRIAAIELLPLDIEFSEVVIGE